MERRTLKYSCACPAYRQQGLSLIELMIGMVIGLVLLGGIMQTMLASKEASATRQSISTITDNARFLFDFMARDLRMGGRGYGGETWPTDSDGDLYAPIEEDDGTLVVRYVGFADTDNDGDTEEAFVEVEYSLNGDEEVVYRRRAGDDRKSGLEEFDYDNLPAKGNFEPLVSAISHFNFEYACYESEPDYEYSEYSEYSGEPADCTWDKVTAVETTVTFTDAAPWGGQGVGDKEISSVVAMRNRVSSLIDSQ
ncbi:PilW family protein [Marinobacterium weihaiense]|uniref:Prepilin-type N-terminal cleavage/methylation domain-containing protein n=1 Tax=Marinobacterium weihaiense TaxID=2851016 RepID=A0ABS6M9T9_9GAMM|nr:prepilin-type N-terminal cleavage/methylation domain-containing protein [Marinobacterium weihaiense]MBV0932995.1 prepilin-type N-terminal cleavage/methylation domain-containing protein [Marinobacterium weihaiense]